MPELKPVIFLIGNVRSGTSMTRKVFEMHPDLSTLREPRTVWMFADPGRKNDRFDESDATPRVIRFIRKRFLQFQREHGGNRLMEKTPSNCMRIPFMRKIFPESKFLYLVREPLANLSSSEKRWQDAVNKNRIIKRLKETPKTQLHFYAWRLFRDHFRKRVLKKKHVSTWGVRYPGIERDIAAMSIEEVIARQWVECCRQAEEDLANLPPEIVTRVRYEDLVEDPVNQFERIFAHFDLELTDAMRAELPEFIDPTRRNKWRSLDPAVLRRCIPIIEEPMKRYGYEIPADVRAEVMGEAVGDSVS